MTKPKSNWTELEGNFSSRKIIPQHLSVGQTFPSASASSLSQRKSWSEPPHFTASLTNCTPGNEKMLYLSQGLCQGNVNNRQSTTHFARRLERKSTCTVLSAASPSLPRHEGWLQCTWCLQQKSLRALITPKAAFLWSPHSQVLLYTPWQCVSITPNPTEPSPAIILLHLTDLKFN